MDVSEISNGERKLKGDDVKARKNQIKKNKNISFFVLPPSTKTALDAFSSEFTTRSYYNGKWHLKAATTIFAHAFRTCVNLAAVFRDVLACTCFLFPLWWRTLPEALYNLIDNTMATWISFVTTIIQPFVFLFRTIASVIYDYDESNWDYPEELHQEDYDRATMVFNP